MSEKRNNRLAWIFFFLFILALLAGIFGTAYLLLVAGR